MQPSLRACQRSVLIVGAFAMACLSTTACEKNSEVEETSVLVAEPLELEAAEEIEGAGASSRTGGCSSEKAVIFACDLGGTEASICAGDDSESITVSMHIPDSPSYVFTVSPERFNEVFLCEFTSPHRTFRYATFNDGERMYRVDFDRVTDPNFAGADDDGDQDDADEKGSSPYRVTITTLSDEKSMTAPCLGDVIDDLIRLQSIEGVRYEAQSC
ncbi:MAG: hypothetical protein ACNA8W_03830 [Bradymonadaceae bacterium]